MNTLGGSQPPKYLSPDATWIVEIRERWKICSTNPEKLAANILAKEERILSIVENIRALLEAKT